ncbi:MAG TPA: hypothetical protein VGB48_09890 [Allosphingosinicella sp.]|jgi:hypothetical protein
MSAPKGSAIRDAALEEAATAAEALDRSGREWVRDSLWANIKSDTARAIRALKQGTALNGTNSKSHIEYQDEAHTQALAAPPAEEDDQKLVALIRGHFWPEDAPPCVEQVEARLAVLAAKKERLRAALEPFAKFHAAARHLLGCASPLALHVQSSVGGEASLTPENFEEASAAIMESE